MDISLIIGNIAAVLTAVSFLPQAIKTLRTRDTDSISLSMYLIFFTGVLLWLTYGILISSIPVILGNIITILFAAPILFVKLQDTLGKGK